MTLNELFSKNYMWFLFYNFIYFYNCVCVTEMIEIIDIYFNKTAV